MKSLTVVTKQDVDTAWENYQRQVEKHEKMLDENIEKWHSTLKFSWWDRNVRKTDKMTAKELYAYELSGRYPFQQEHWSKKMGIWNDEFDWTLGNRGWESRDTVQRLYRSNKETHFVDSRTLSWIITWRDRDV